MKKITYRITPVGISVFTGIGGMDIGFKRAGGQLLLGADWELFTGIVHENNKANVKDELWTEGGFLSGDKYGNIKRMNGLDVLDYINKTLKLNYVPGQIDFLFGGPPCPPFSINNLKRNAFDERALLIFHMLRLAREIKPKVVIIEQVPQVRSPAIMPFWNKLRIILDSMTDYHWNHKVLNAMNYGGRQSRKRRIFYLVRKDLGVMPSFPEPKEPDMSKVSAHILLPHLQHFSSGQGKDIIYRTENRMFLTITAGASEWGYENGVKRKLHLIEKQVMTETEGQILTGLTKTEQNTGLGNMVSSSLMAALTEHATINFLKYG